MRYTLAVGYCVVMGSWIYWLDAGHENTWWTVVPLALFQVGIGFALARWWALLLPLALPVLALPAGYPESRYSEPLPLWFGMIYAAALAIPLVLVGVAARRLSDRFGAGARLLAAERES